MGLNRFAQVCKVCVVVTLDGRSLWGDGAEDEKQDDSDDKDQEEVLRNRHLFLCIGSDRGLKSFYITQGLKWRDRYRVTMPGVTLLEKLDQYTTLVAIA